MVPEPLPSRVADLSPCPSPARRGARATPLPFRYKIPEWSGGEKGPGVGSIPDLAASGLVLRAIGRLCWVVRTQSLDGTGRGVRLAATNVGAQLDRSGSKGPATPSEKKRRRGQFCLPSPRTTRFFMEMWPLLTDRCRAARWLERPGRRQSSSPRCGYPRLVVWLGRRHRPARVPE
jgi:hypothetical protein